jgi:AP-1 complex subunit mu
VIEHFSQKLLEIDENMSWPLIWLEKQKLCFFYKRVNNVIIVLVSENNSNCIMMFSLIYKLVQVLTDYFKEIDEESVRDNFVIIYELLDEMIDNGYP